MPSKLVKTKCFTLSIIVINSYASDYPIFKVFTAEKQAGPLLKDIGSVSFKPTSVM